MDHSVGLLVRLRSIVHYFLYAAPPVRNKQVDDLNICWNSVIWKKICCPQMGCIPLNWSAQRQVPHNAVKSSFL